MGNLQYLCIRVLYFGGQLDKLYFPVHLPWEIKLHVKYISYHVITVFLFR